MENEEQEEQEKITLASHLDAKAAMTDRGNNTQSTSSMQSWLKLHQTSSEARFVFQSWLDSKGDISLLEAPIQAWLEQHQTELGAKCIYQSWLSANGDKTVIAASVQAWLSEHQTNQESGSFYKCWLETTGEHHFIESAVQAWLKQHQDLQIAEFVYMGWLKSNGETATIETPIQSWLNKHINTPAALRLCADWIKAGGRFAIIKPVVEATLSKIKHSINPGQNEIISHYIQLYYALKNYPTKHELEYWQLLLSMFAHWFKTCANFDELPIGKRFIYNQSPGIIHLLEESLQNNLIEPVPDANQLDAFFSWVDRWYPYRKDKIKEDLDSLQSLWNLGAQVRIL